MLPLWEMLSRSGGADALARHFELSRLQAQNAVDALLPAFSEGFRRFTADPSGTAAFMSALASGHHARYFEDAAKAFAPQGTEDGQAILRRLFGADAFSQSLADQAARMSGLGSDTVMRMMPALAAMLMGGLAAQAKAAPREAASNPFSAMMEAMAGPARKTASTDPWAGNPWMAAMNASAPDEAWGRLFKQWMGAAAPPPQPPPKPADPARAMFDEMFETGRKTQAEYARLVQSLFDQWGKPTRG